MTVSSFALIQKIERLPPDRMAEVVDFVEFLQMKEQTQSFTRQAAQVSAPAFAAVWDNTEDEAYDALWVWRRSFGAFPFTNQATSKQRPAVVISSRIYGESRPDVVLMAITSQVRTVAVSFGDTPLVDWQSAHLLKPSAVKPVVATLEQSLVIKQLGQLTAQDQAALKQTISTLIGWVSLGSYLGRPERTNLSGSEEFAQTMQQTLAYQGKASSAEIPRAQRRAKAKSLSFYTSTFQEDPKQGMLAAYATGDYTLQAVADAFGMQSTEIKVKLAP